MKKLNFLCIIGILAVSCFALSFSSQADELDDLAGNPEKSYYFVYATGAIQGSFGTMETCVYCHGNGGKGTSEGRKRGVPDFTDAAWQSSKTDEEMGIIYHQRLLENFKEYTCHSRKLNSGLG